MGVLAAVAGAGVGRSASWGDQAVIQLSTDRATGFHQLVGPYSRFGWSHPGPLWFYLLGGPYRALGTDTRALVVAAVLVSGLFALGVVALAGWLAGRTAGRWAAALAAAELAALGPAALARVWNPVAVVVPTAGLLVACAGVAVGRWWALPWAVGLGSFLVQTDVGTGLAVGAAGAVAVVAGAVGSGRRSGALRDAGWPVAASVATGLVLWLPALVQEASGHPGNLGEVARFFTSAHPGHPLGTGVSAVAGSLWPPLRGRTGGAGPAGAVAWVLVAAGLVWSAGAAVAGLARRRRPESRVAGGLGAVTAVVLIAGVVSATRVVGPLFPYLTLWLSACGTGLALSALLAWRPARAGTAATAAAAVACAALLVVAAVARPSPAPGGQQVAALWSGLRRSLPSPSAGPVRVDVATADRWPWAAGLLVELTHHGYTAFADRQWLFLFGTRLGGSGRPAATVAVWRPGGPTRRPPGGAVSRSGDTAVIVTPGAGAPGAGP